MQHSRALSSNQALALGIKAQSTGIVPHQGA